MSVGRAAIMLASLLLVGCGISDDEERKRVLTQLDQLREMPTNHPQQMLEAAEALAILPVENAKTKEARDTCAKAHIDRARMYALVQELEAEVKAPALKSDPKVLADKYRLADELERTLGAELEACSLRYTQLLTAK